MTSEIFQYFKIEEATGLKGAIYSHWLYSCIGFVQLSLVLEEDGWMDG